MGRRPLPGLFPSGPFLPLPDFFLNGRLFPRRNGLAVLLRREYLVGPAAQLFFPLSRRLCALGLKGAGGELENKRESAIMFRAVPEEWGITS